MKTILVPVDFSGNTERVIAEAERMARLSGGTLTLIHVAAPEPAFVGYEPGPPTVRATTAHELRDEHRTIQKLEQEVNARGVAARALLIQGYPAEKIVEEAGRLGADLIVMGSHGHKMLKRLVVGSVTDGVLRKAACPVLIVPARGA